MARATRTGKPPALLILAALPVQGLSDDRGERDAGQHAGVDDQRACDEPSAVPRRSGDAALRGELHRPLRPPPDLDLVDAGGEPTRPPPSLDHRGRLAQTDYQPCPEEMQPAGKRGRTGTDGAVGDSRRTESCRFGVLVDEEVRLEA